MQIKQEEYGKATAYKSDKHSKFSDPKSGQFAKKSAGRTNPKQTQSFRGKTNCPA